MRAFFCSLVIMLSCSTVFGQVSPVIEGANKAYNVGDMIKLKLSGFDGAADWTITNSSGDAVPFENINGVVRLGTGPIPTKITIVVTTEYETKNQLGQETYVKLKTKTVVTVGDGGNVVPIPPKPVPDPIKPDPVPDNVDFGKEKFGLGKFTYDLATKEKVKSDLAKEIGKSYSTVATQIAAGVIKSKLDAITKVKELNDNAMFAAGVKSKDLEKFFVPLEDKCFDLQTAKPNGLTTLDDFKVAFNEIANGLGKVK